MNDPIAARRLDGNRSARLASVLALVCGAAIVACTASPGDGDGAGEGEEGAVAESGISAGETSSTTERCDAIRPGRPWTPEEGKRLVDLVVEGFARTKLENDRLVRERGVGNFGGFRTTFGARLMRGDKAGAADALRSHVKVGSADAIVDTMSGSLEHGNVTSCVGWAMRALGEAYAELGRSDEWKPILACAEAWDSVGTRLQGALVKSGWPSPGVAIVGDETPAPSWSADERAVHEGLLGAIPRGTYFGAPISKTVVLRNFLPWPGSSTPRDERRLLALGKSSFLAVGTLRAAYHVPVVVPAASVPDTLAPAGPTRAAWLAARTRGEPFVLESHSLRQPWDATSFEVKPLTEVMRATYTAKAVYSTGTLLFAPFSDPLR